MQICSQINMSSVITCSSERSESIGTKIIALGAVLFELPQKLVFAPRKKPSHPPKESRIQDGSFFLKKKLLGC